MKISILHPFSPKSVGVVEKSVQQYHSQPHVAALKKLISIGHECSIDYFTDKIFGYKLKSDNILWNFFRLDFKFNGDHKKWKKQQSKACYKYYKKNMPDIVYINMSGHSSPFSHKLGKLILNKGSKYVAMLGGQHYSATVGNIEYYKNASQIIVHTELQKAAMLKMDMFFNSDIRVYPLGVDCEHFKPAESKTSVDPSLLYVGRIVDWKRVHVCIETVMALKKQGFKNTVLNIIGPISSEAYYQKLKELIKKNSLENNVFFLGYKDYNELPIYYSKSDIFLLPSDKETFGMVMIEAMSCGVPVAGINCPGGPADVIENNVDGILCGIEEYPNRIVAYFKDKDLQKQMSANARKKVLEKYSLEITNKVILNSVKDM
jgi:glycosyltransferase involved in cell wall biosynthesis